MSVIATLVIGANGATSLHGGSSPLSTPADRQRFLGLHRSAGAYITGRNSFQSETYRKAEAPVLILSRSSYPVKGATVIDTSNGLVEAMREVVTNYISPIIVEAGATLFLELLKSGCIEECELSIVPLDGDSHMINMDEVLSYLETLDEQIVDGTRLLKCRYTGGSAYS